PDKQAIRDGDVIHTYRQFAERVACWRGLLKSRDVHRGEVVAILSPNSHLFMEAYYAAAVSGVVLAPLNFRLASREIKMILRDSEAKLLFAHKTFEPQVDTDVPIIWFGEKQAEAFEALLAATEPD